MADKVLIIDYLNQLHRANYSFTTVKSKAKPTNGAGSNDGAAENPPDAPTKAEEEQEEKVWGDNILPPPPPREYNPNFAIIPPEHILTYNFFRNLRPQIEQFQPSKVFLALEGHPQFRYDIYPGYKANRKGGLIKEGSVVQESKERVIATSPNILRLLKMLPITQVRAERYEADDTIFTLANDMREEEITIISSDKDFIQLLQKGFKSLCLWNPLRKEYRESPEYAALCFKVLNGDASDNIKGLVGARKAKTLASNPAKLKKFLEQEENRAHFEINRLLIELRLVPPEELIIEEGMTDFDGLRAEFERMEFKSMLSEPYWSRFKETFSCITI